MYLGYLLIDASVCITTVPWITLFKLLQRVLGMDNPFCLKEKTNLF